IRTHNLIGDSPVRRSLLLAPSGFEGVPNRLKVYEPFSTLGAAVPKRSVLLAHDVAMILGFNRNWITDLHQSLISYGRLREPAAIHETLRRLGTTHLLWPEWTFERESLAADLAFMNYALNYTRPITALGGYHVSALPVSTPNKLGGNRVAVVSCGASYVNGWYDLAQLTLPRLNPGSAPKRWAEVSSLASAEESADYIVWGASCNTTSPSAKFIFAARRAGEMLYVRNQRQSPSKPP
ncbi:MAG TPA: hypothetical protein VK509_23405, partial [Polyangiales bacterium]|nr:hypothetical protein [Polyangiales bacterium]